MKRMILYAGIAVFMMACSDDPKVEPVNNEAAPAEKSAEKPAEKKENPKTDITIGPDSVGVTTKKGDKVQVGKGGAGVENKDVKVRVKKDTTQH